MKVTCTQTIIKDNKKSICGKIALLRCPHVLDICDCNKFCDIGVCSGCFKKIAVSNENE